MAFVAELRQKAGQGRAIPLADAGKSLAEMERAAERQDEDAAVEWLHKEGELPLQHNLQRALQKRLLRERLSFALETGLPPRVLFSLASGIPKRNWDAEGIYKILGALRFDMSCGLGFAEAVLQWRPDFVLSRKFFSHCVQCHLSLAKLFWKLWSSPFTADLVQACQDWPHDKVFKSAFLSFVPRELWDNQNFLIMGASRVNDEGASFALLPPDTQRNLDVAKAFCSRQRGCLMHTGPLRAHPDLVRLAVEVDGFELQEARGTDPTQESPLWSESSLLALAVRSSGAAFLTQSFLGEKAATSKVVLGDILASDIYFRMNQQPTEHSLCLLPFLGPDLLEDPVVIGAIFESASAHPTLSHLSAEDWAADFDVRRAWRHIPQPGKQPSLLLAEPRLWCFMEEPVASQFKGIAAAMFLNPPWLDCTPLALAGEVAARMISTAPHRNRLLDSMMWQRLSKREDLVQLAFDNSPALHIVDLALHDAFPRDLLNAIWQAGSVSRCLELLKPMEDRVGSRVSASREKFCQLWEKSEFKSVEGEGIHTHTHNDANTHTKNDP